MTATGVESGHGSVSSASEAAPTGVTVRDAEETVSPATMTPATTKVATNTTTARPIATPSCTRPRRWASRRTRLGWVEGFASGVRACFTGLSVRLQGRRRVLVGSDTPRRTFLRNPSDWATLVACSDCDPAVNAATATFRPSRPTLGSARSSAPGAWIARRVRSAACARTAAATWNDGPSDPPRCSSRRRRRRRGSSIPPATRPGRARRRTGSPIE